MSQSAQETVHVGDHSRRPADLDQLRQLELPTRLELQQRRESSAQPSASGSRPTSHRQVSIGSGMLGGAAAFVGGFMVAGAAHYAGGARALREEGIDPRVRLKAVPMALRALAVSTAMCGVLGALGAAALHLALKVQPVANISSVGDAIKLARQQRAAVQAEFQARLHPDGQGKGRKDA